MFDDFDETGCHENHFHVLLVSFTFKQTTPPSLQKTKHEASIKNQNNFRVSKTEQLSPKESVLLSNNLREELKTFFHNVSQCEHGEDAAAMKMRAASSNALKCNIANKRWRYLIPVLCISSMFLPCFKLKKYGFKAN